MEHRSILLQPPKSSAYQKLPQFPSWAVCHIEEPFQVALDTWCAMTNKILSVVHTSIAGFSYQTPPAALV